MAIKFLNTATAATQAVGDNSTKIATTAYADAAAAAIPIGNYLPLAGGTMNTNAAITMSGSLTTSANVYAQRFYDQGDNTFYGDFAGTSQFNHVKINSVLGTRNFVNGSYGWQFEQSTTTADPVTFRFDNQKYRVYAGGGAGEIMTFLEGGNIGIGMTNPGVKLDVSDVIRGRNSIRVDAASTGSPYLGLYQNGLEKAYLQYQDSGDKLVLQSDGYFALKTGGESDRITVLGDGKVGIGTTSPDILLTLNESTNNTTLGFYNDGTDTANRNWTIGSNDQVFGDFVIKTSTAKGGNPISAGVARLYIDPVGNVGIGTTSPSYQLTLGGNAAGSTEGLRINDPSNAAYGAHFSFSDTPNEVWIGGITNNTYNSAIGIHREATRAITIDVNSNVGIGTTNPGYKLEVNAGNGIFVGDGGAAVLSANSTTGIFTIGDTDELGDGVYATNTSTSSFDIYSAGSIKFRMDVDGNVGIGTTSPGAKLDVYGTIKSNTNGNRSKGNINIGLTTNNSTKWSSITGTQYAYNTETEGFSIINGLATSAINAVYIGGALNEQNAATEIGFYTASNTTTRTGSIKMKIIANGNVGIGTTSPYGKLDVDGNIRLQSGNRIYFGGTGSIPYWTAGVDNTTNNNFVIGGQSYYSGDRDILLTPVNNGNVGIGTTSPSSKLSVNGGVQVANDTATASASNAGTIRYRVSGTNSYMDMSMRTGYTTYAWVNIVQNNW